ncbi:MAG: hypothetical protein R2681_10545 [Pyrinomonadaceae bacterium]
MMRSAMFAFLLVVFFGISSFAQVSKNELSKLPAGIEDWNENDSEKVFEDPVIAARLKLLLGEADHAVFLESFETRRPLDKKDGIIFVSGCMIRACSHLESAIAIDLAANTIHAAIFNEIEETRFFNEKESETPQIIAVWSKRLEEIYAGNHPANRRPLRQR